MLVGMMLRQDNNERQQQRIMHGYKELDLLGNGSFSEVYKVQIGEEYFALKRIYGSALEDKVYRECINREIEIMQKLKHPHIVKLMEVLEGENSLELLLEYVGGGTLFDLMQTHQQLPESTVRNYVRDIADVLAYLHAFPCPILHRDIKPENILLDEYGNIKLCDFGTANQIVGRMKRDSYVGTPQYMAPEIRDNLPHDESVDIWCLGVLIYQLLTGRTDQDTLETQAIEYPEYLSRPAVQLLQGILVKDPKCRLTLAQIQNHIWLMEDSVGLPELTPSSSTISNFSSKNSMLNKKHQKHHLQEQAQNQAKAYMGKLKHLNELKLVQKQNERRLSLMREALRQKERLDDVEISSLNEKIMEYRKNIGLLEGKEPTPRSETLNCLKSLCSHLNDLEEYVNNIPQLTKDKICQFSDPGEERMRCEIESVGQEVTKRRLDMMKVYIGELKNLRAVQLQRKKTTSEMDLWETNSLDRTQDRLFIPK